MCMITGDAEDTAVAVASAIGFFDPSQHRTLSGAGIEHMSPSELEVSGARPTEAVQPLRALLSYASDNDDRPSIT